MADAPDDIVCLRCMTWHVPPMCDHDPTRACLTCGGLRGFRFRDDDGRLHRAVECWRCALGLARAA